MVDINKKLDLFEERVKEFQVPTLNERSNSPVDYCKLYRERYMPQKEKSLALGAKVTYLIPPTGKYAALGKNALVDGLFGGATFVDSWIGWEGTDGAFVIDLGEAKEIHSVETDFLHQIGAWILFPLKVVYSYAEDGEHYTHWRTIDLPEERTGEVKFRGVKTESAEPIKISLCESRSHRNERMSDLALWCRPSFVVFYRRSDNKIKKVGGRR